MTDIPELIDSLAAKTERAAENPDGTNWGAEYATDVTILLSVVARIRELISNPLADYPLGERERMVCLDYMMNRPVTEIAEDLDVSRKHVYSIMGDALETMSAHDGKEYERDDLRTMLHRKLTETIGPAE